MDYFHLNRIHEADVDQIVADCGGRRVVGDDSAVTEPNADYVLHEALIELKLFEEEGLEKETRRRKVAEIFSDALPDRPVVVLDPTLLGEEQRRKYYNAMEGPIKTQVKKAARQLHSTWGNHGCRHVRVLLAVNNGYTALDQEEFASLVLKCAANDTSKIDFVVVGGVYYYSDKFDNYFIAPFELISVNRTAEFPSFEQLRDGWYRHVEQEMTAMIMREAPIDDRKLPVMDLGYEIDGVKFVKPAPPIGGTSDFYPEGRPRENSTGIEQCPPVATTFPKLSQLEWQAFREALPHERLLQVDYPTWCEWSREESRRVGTETQPFVPVDVDLRSFERWCSESGQPMSFKCLCKFSNWVFDKRVKEVIHSAKPRDETGLVHPHHIWLVTEEIGQDRANDLSSIYYVSELPGFEREEAILEHRALFFEYALALASAYALKHEVEAVLYEIDQTYCWV